MRKPDLKCRKCGSVFHFPVKRSWFVRNVLFFLPIRVFFCAKCLENRYKLLTDKEAEKYNPVL